MEQKIEVLIYNLLVSEVWKEKVFPLIKGKLESVSSVKPYLTLYHEATIANLLEVLMFHRDSTECNEDYLVELIDFCYRKLVYLVNLHEKRPSERPSGKEAIEMSA